MKTISKSMTIGLSAALISSVAMMPQTVQAGDKEWSTAGKILTGVVVLDFLSNHLPASERRVERVESVCRPMPPPRHYPVAVHRPSWERQQKVWHEGHYIYVPRKVWVDTSYEVEEWVQGHRRPDGAWVDGHMIRRTVRDGYWKTYDEKVWVEAGYE